MKEIKLNVTPVFHKNWEVLNALNEDGTRKYRYGINTGSSRSSKTFSLIDVYDIAARSHYNKRLTVWRDTKTDCVKTVLPDAELHFKNTGRFGTMDFNVTKSIFKYSTGSTFEFHGTDDETTVHGLNQHIAWLNEPYKISREVFDQIDQRTEDFIFIDWNPRKAHYIEDIAKDKRAIVIHSTFLDNSFCPPEQRNKILSYQPLSMCSVVIEKVLSEKEANEYNLIDNFLLFPPSVLAEIARCRENERKRSASAYNWNVYGLGVKAEKPNRIFKWEEIGLSDYQALDVPTYYYSDWGAVDPWAIGEIKYYDGALYVRELNYTSENELRMKLTSTELQQLAGIEDEGIVSWHFNRLGIENSNYIICDSNRPRKILALRSAGFDYAVAAPKGTGSIVDGIDLLNDLKVFYTSDSENIKYEQENYSRKVDRYGIVLEEPEDMDNHHMDGIRYVGTFLQDQGIIRKV